MTPAEAAATAAAAAACAPEGAWPEGGGEDIIEDELADTGDTEPEKEERRAKIWGVPEPPLKLAGALN